MKNYLYKWFAWITERHLNELLGLLFIALAVVRVIWPKANIDLTTILLIIIAIILIRPEFIRYIIPFIKKIKIGNVEIEIGELIRKITQEVEQAQESAGEEFRIQPPENISDDINQILIETSKDPRAAFLLLAAKIEQQIKSRIQKAGILEGNRFMPLSKMVQLGVREGIFPQDILPAFRDFWNIRNRVAHGEAFDVENSVIISLISLGSEILKIISTEKTNFQKEIFSS